MIRISNSVFTCQLMSTWKLHTLQNHVNMETPDTAKADNRQYLFDIASYKYEVIHTHTEITKNKYQDVKSLIVAYPLS